jgi:hypothetical protein
MFTEDGKAMTSIFLPSSANTEVWPMKERLFEMVGLASIHGPL